MREIEIKLKVGDPGELEGKLAERGCALSAPIYQHDTVYVQADKADKAYRTKEGDIILRIRRLENGAEFTFKKQCSNEMDNIEYETEIGNPEAAHQILLAFGYVPQVEVKKIRRKGKIESYEVCLDKVEKLGDFMELEKMTEDNTDSNETREELFRVLENLGLSRSDEETRGYDTQILQMNNT